MHHLLVLALLQAPGFYSKPQPVVAPPQRSVYRPHGYYGAPYFWWMTRPEPARSSEKPEKEAPGYVINKDYVKERLSPQITLYPEGTLPLPARPPAHALSLASCRVKMKDGETIEGRHCSVVDDVLRYVTPQGRAVRVSLDLVEGY